MNMNDLKSGEPFFREWYIDQFIGTSQGGSVFKIFREQNGQREFSIMKVFGIPRDKIENDDVLTKKIEDDAEACYYKELVTDIYREICLLEKLPDRQHIVCYENHMIFKRKNAIGYDIFIRMELLEEFRESVNAAFMTFQDVIHLGKNICDALDLCERFHIVHGNICPECIYLSEHGQYKLGDFTFSRLERQVGGNTSLNRNNEYLAPEILAGEHYDSRADIYSLGLLLYSCLNNNQLPNNLINKPLPVGATKEFGQVILKACDPKPENRYQTAEEFKDALIAIGVFLGESLTELINPQIMEDAEIYVAATQEDSEEVEKISLKEKALQEAQLLEEMTLHLSEQVQTYEDNTKKDKGKVTQATAKKTKNMGPWILVIWVSVITIAVIVILLKSNLGLENRGDTQEVLLPTQAVKPTQALVLEEENIPTNAEKITPTKEVTSEVNPTNTVSIEPNQESPSMILESGKGLIDLSELGPMEKATIIDLSENSISDISLLSKATNVEKLKLNRNKIVNIKELNQLSNLKELDLSDNRITSAEKLGGLTKLEVLSLSNNQLDNTLGVEKLTNLTILYLNGNKISDVTKLSSLKNLMFIDLSDNELSEDDIHRLQKSLPDCMINY